MIAKLMGEFHHFEVLRQNIDCKQKKRIHMRLKKASQMRRASAIPRFMKHFPWILFHIQGRKLFAICCTNP